MGDIDESDVSGWSNQKLNRFVDGWLGGHATLDCADCHFRNTDAPGRAEWGEIPDECPACGGDEVTALPAPDYCGDALGCMRLLDTGNFGIDPPSPNRDTYQITAYSSGKCMRSEVTTLYADGKYEIARKLAEGAAILRIRGVELRGVSE